MTCWKWFDSLIKEAGLKITESNKDKIEEVIHKYIGEQASYGRCSTQWKKALKQIQADEKMKKELIDRLKTLT
ncbi:MAG: hypothetical protein NZ922_01215 [Candidatus Methanomethyliaceae archaeon]|nr:hypothetical protein [Candidatus Methanomethyliaceae archaeon]MDW7971493.1 hypothetical protein [Nitrososphaerota archaeon]